ncbi:MAG: rhomboid family intramembrane serine protease [Betaproteobacteria bacterium]|nr:rhomboid family intramembrane serine protease [Betaproteobacteria bacterium]
MLLIFPLNDKPDWRHPPWITMLLILANVLVYFGPQSRDENAADTAASFYLRSPLPRLELPRYAEYLRARGDRDSRLWAERIDTALAKGRFEGPYALMRRDQRFLARLRAGQVLRPDEPGYAQWREQRLRYDAIRGTPFTERWASNPADWNPVTAVTSVFLHGGVAHLLGNMLFLFVFGYTVEKTLGGRRYLAFYLLAGIGGALCDLAVRWGSHSIGLGASGAISGLMAMYVVLYGRRPIKFFYQLLFYFDYVTAPAIILLPAWIAHEIFQQWFGDEGVAYMAHAGGLVTGAMLTAWHKHKHPETQVPASEPPSDPGMEELARAEALVKQLKIDEARDAFARLAATRPRDSRVVSQYFNLARLAPASEDFHRAAALMFALNDTDAPTSALIHEGFSTYVKTAKPAARLTSEDLARLALRFGREGHSADAARLARMLLGRTPGHAALPGVLLAAANALRRQGSVERAEDLSRELRERFPHSAEARLAAAPGRD